MWEHARTVTRIGMTALCAAALVAPALAGQVTSTTDLREYDMDGDTPVAIVDYFHSHPFEGDHGPALANLRYTANVSVATRETESRCAVASVRLDMDFVVTLPRAEDYSTMSGRTRAMWNQLAAFAKAHEYGHRAMYLQCARNFVARAARVTAESCAGVERTIDDMLEASEAACDRLQLGYDERESKRAANLALFRTARGGR